MPGLIEKRDQSAAAEKITGELCEAYGEAFLTKLVPAVQQPKPSGTLQFLKVTVPEGKGCDLKTE